MDKICEWEKDEAYFGDDRHFATECGEAWYFTDGGVKDNGISFCPYCGGKIKEHHPKEEIRPSEAGELWENEDFFCLTYKDRNSDITVREQDGDFFMVRSIVGDKVIHGQNGWTRLCPPVNDGEVIVIEGVTWERRDGWCVPLGVDGVEVDMINKPPMTMTLTIPREG